MLAKIPLYVAAGPTISEASPNATGSEVFHFIFGAVSVFACLLFNTRRQYFRLAGMRGCASEQIGVRDRHILDEILLILP